jgi:hypothetical protein
MKPSLSFLPNHSAERSLGPLAAVLDARDSQVEVLGAQADRTTAPAASAGRLPRENISTNLFKPNKHFTIEGNYV